MHTCRPIQVVFPTLGLFLRCSLTVVAMLMTSFLIWCQVKSYVTNWQSHDFFRNKSLGARCYGYCVPGIVGGFRMAPGKRNRYCANLIKQYPFCFICMCCVISAPVCREDFSREYHSDELVRWDSYANFHTVSDGK